jgi:hypothetical protein
VPCFGLNEVIPEGKTPWKYVNRYGETNLKFVNYRLQDVRERKRRRRGEHRLNKLDGPYGPEVALGYNTEDSINFRDAPETLYVQILTVTLFIIKDSMAYVFNLCICLSVSKTLTMLVSFRL